MFCPPRLQRILFGVASALFIAGIGVPMGLARIQPKPNFEAEVQTLVIQKGDTLWSLATEHLGNPLRWRTFERYNTFSDPSQIYPGEKMLIPVTAQISPQDSRAQPGQRGTQDYQHPDVESEEEAIETLSMQMQDEDVSIRRRSALELGQIEKPSGDVVSLLIKALSDEDYGVRRNASYALAQIAERVKETVPLLGEILKRHEGEFLQWWVATTLKQIGTPEALKAVEQFE